MLEVTLTFTMFNNEYACLYLFTWDKYLQGEKLFKEELNLKWGS